MKIKYLSITILLALITLIASCGKSDREKAFEDPWDNKTGKRIPLTFAIPTSIDSIHDKEDPLYASRLKAVARELEKRNSKYFINFVHTRNPLSKFVERNSGMKIDGAFVKVTDSGFYLSISDARFREISNIKDITREFPDFAPEYFSKFSPDELLPVTQNGRIYAIPSYQLPRTRRVCAFIREDLAEKYNITEFNGWSEYEAFLTKLLQGEPKVEPAVFFATTCELFAEEMGYTIFYRDNVYKTKDPEKKLLSFYETPAYKNVLERLNSWSRKGFVRTYQRPLEDEINSGRFASFLAMSPFGSYLDGVLIENGRTDIKYRQVEILPQVITERLLDPGNVIAFNKSSPNVKHAISFLGWLQKDIENYRLMIYGLEGKDYKLNKDNLPVPVAPDSRVLDDALYFWQKNWFLYNVDNDEYVSKDKKKGQLRFIKLKSEYAPHHGFPDGNILTQLQISEDYANGYYLTSEEWYIFLKRYSVQEALDKTLEHQKKLRPNEQYFIQMQEKLKKWNWKEHRIK